jgi:carbon-monoxide dehydrogenase small subunit
MEEIMQIKLWINNTEFSGEISPDTILLDFLRDKGFLSVKRGCETSNCGLCTVLLEEKPILSCSTLAVRANGLHVTTIEGIQEEAEEFGNFLANEGAEQCGFCSPGFIMNVISMKRELNNPTEDQIKKYLEGNLCRCTGYMGQLRAIKKYLKSLNAKEGTHEICK